MQACFLFSCFHLNDKRWRETNSHILSPTSVFLSPAPPSSPTLSHFCLWVYAAFKLSYSYCECWAEFFPQKRSEQALLKEYYISYLFSNSEMSACSLRCHFSAWRKSCRSNSTLVWAVLMSSDSTSPLTTASKPSSISVTSSAVNMSSVNLVSWQMKFKVHRSYNLTLIKKADLLQKKFVSCTCTIERISVMNTKTPK